LVIWSDMIDYLLAIGRIREEEEKKKTRGSIYFGGFCFGK